MAPVIVLFFLSPIIGELLSGSAPPVEFFNPFGLLILPALYGSGAILARESSLSWGKRWPTILALGLAYGIIEEGLMVKSFFDPSWPDLGLLGVYGRWGGVNWVWTVFLTLYHAVFSIAIPILLVEIIFLTRRDERWLGRKGMIFFGALLLLVVVLGFAVLTPYRPPVFVYLLAVISVIVLVIIARRLPARWAPMGQTPRWRPLWMGVFGFIATIIFFAHGWVLPEIGVPPVITIFSMGLFAWLTLRIIRWFSGEGAWGDDGRAALASGALTFFILLGPLAEMDPTRPDNPAGMTLVAIVALIALIALRIRVNRREKLPDQLKTAT